MGREEIINDLDKLLTHLYEEYGWSFTAEEFINTPTRIVNMFDEWKKKSKYEKFTVFENTMKYDQMIVLKNIRFYALCSHHLLPFDGYISVGYIPDKVVIGASKMARIVNSFAYQPTIQERMTLQIARKMKEVVETDSVMVVVKAEHMCMRCRGVEKDEAEMITSQVGGSFREDDKTRKEFLELIK